MAYKRTCGPESIGDILGELVARRGLARVRQQQQLEQVWNQAVGEPLAKYTRPGSIRRGVLDVYVQNSVLMQELASFRKAQLVQTVSKLIGSEITDIKFHLDECD